MLKVSSDSLILRAMKSHTNEHTVRGRPTLKNVERFRSGSVRKPYGRPIYEETFMSEPIEHLVIPNELSNLNLEKKHLQKRHRIFRHDREPGRIPMQTLERLSNRSEKV